MSQSSRVKSIAATLVVVAVTAATVLVVVLMQRHDADGSLSSTAAASASEGATDPDPNEDINSLPTPSESISPADKSTIKPPDGDTDTFDPKEDWETGVFHDDGAPTSSINFVAENYWNGYLDGAPITVYGGSPGYEHPKDGAVFVITVTPEGNYGRGSIQAIEGSGPLSVVSGVDSKSVILKNDSGATFVYDLSSHRLSPQN